MVRSAPLIALALLAGPAFGQSAALSAQDFISQAAKSDMFEIQSSQLAADRMDGKTKAFAERMLADHRRTTDELTGMVSRNAVKAELPTAMDPAQQAELEKLKSLQGDAFAKEYRNAQVTAHQKAVTMFKQYAADADHAGLKLWVMNTEPALEEHLRMAEDLPQ